PADSRPTHLLTLSAQSDAALQALAGRYGEYLAAPDAAALADVAYTASTGRAHFNERLALVASSHEEARQKLIEGATGRHQATASSDPAEIAFLFTGQGAQYAGMGRQLYVMHPTFRAALDDCDALLRPHLDRSLLSILFDAEQQLIHQTAYTQPALFALEYALAQLWRSWGVEPSFLRGQSVVRYVAG